MCIIHCELDQYPLIMDQCFDLPFVSVITHKCKQNTPSKGGIVREYFDQPFHAFHHYFITIGNFLDLDIYPKKNVVLNPPP